jgi:hypothetical protein
MSVDVKINLPAFTRAVTRQATPIIDDDLQIIHSHLVEGFNQPKSGRIYRRPQGGDYQASAPGESPARRSGDLERSISDPQVREISGGVVGEIKITAPHAKYLERGTPRMASRPFIRPAVDALLGGLGRIGGR